MAEYIAIFICRKLADAVVKQVLPLYSVNEQVEKVSRELTRIQAFLKDADRKQIRDERQKNWVKEVRDIAHSIEDAIDTFLMDIPQKSGMWATIKNMLRKTKKLRAVHNLVNEINQILEKMKEIEESRARIWPDWTDLPADMLPIISEKAVRLELPADTLPIISEKAVSLELPADTLPIISEKAVSLELPADTLPIISEKAVNLELPDWTYLPLNTLPIISEKACSTNLQYLNFRMVCKTWGTAVFPCPQHLRGPWLMLPRPPKDVCHDTGIDPSDLSFYDLFTSQTHQFHLPIISDKYICGSSRGWLALEHDHRVTLLNPITGSSIALPSFDRTILRVATSKRKRSVRANQHEQYTLCVTKVTFSCNPSEPGCVVVAWFLSSDWDLGFCRIGDTHWTGLKKREHSGSGLLDFICHNNMVYTINQRKEVSVYDIQDLSVRELSSQIHGIYHQVNLVEGGAVSGEPFVVMRTEYSRNTKFVVHKWFDDRQQWCPVRDIGKRVVFLGRSHCISMHSINMQLVEQGERRRESEIFYLVRCPLNIESFKVGINRVNLESGRDVPYNPSPLEVFSWNIESSISGYGMWFTPSLI